MSLHVVVSVAIYQYTSKQNNIYVNDEIIFSERELKNVYSRSRLLYSITRPSVICKVCVTYSAGWNYWKCFYAVWYFGHPLTFAENFTEIVPGVPLHQGV